METLFRKYFWAVNLLFLLLAAFLTAKTVNTFVAGSLAPVPELNAPPPAAMGQGPQKTALSPEALSKVTGIELPKPEPEVVEPSQQASNQDVSSQDPVKTGLRVRLIGTLVATNNPAWSMANIEDAASHDVNVYMIGDKVQGAEVIEIERLRVLINNNGRKEYIDSEPGTGDVVAAAPVHPTVAANTNPPPSGPAGQGIRALSDNNYEIDRSEIDKTLGNLNDIAMQARIVPAFKDGVATGFKLFSIRPDSLYTKIGIQNGDVIRRINGYEMNSPDKALEIYQKLKESNRIEIEIDRNGSAVKKTYNVNQR